MTNTNDNTEHAPDAKPHAREPKSSEKAEQKAKHPTDGMSEDETRRLATTIQRFWSARGVHVDVQIIRVPAGQGVSAHLAIKTPNLIRGLPMPPART
jgi:hypothetical protein